MSDATKSVFDHSTADECGFSTVQLSFSTADIERSVFFAEAHEPHFGQDAREPQQGGGDGMVVYRMVDQKFYAVTDDAPAGLKPATGELGLLRLKSG